MVRDSETPETPETPGLPESWTPKLSDFLNPCEVNGCVFVELPIFSDEIFGQYEWQSWNIRNLRKDNDFADVTLACEDGHQGETDKVILAGQVLFH